MQLSSTTVQSFFAAFLFRHYHQQGSTVVYEDAKRNARWLIPHGDANWIQEGGLQDFVEQLKLPATVYICDVGGHNSPEPLICSALTIVLASSDPLHFKEWLKNHLKPTVYMPVWSAEEVAAVVPAVFRQRFLSDQLTSIYPGRLRLHGGIARIIFASALDQELEYKLDQLIKKCNLVSLLQSIVAGDRILSLQLLQHVLETKPDGSLDFQHKTLDFASDEICERVMKEKEERGANEVVSFLLESAGKPDVGGMRGKVFELWAHRVLVAGGTFKARWENDASQTEMYIKFHSSKQKGINNVKDLTVLAAGVSYSRWHTSYCAVYECMWHHHQFFSI